MMTITETPPNRKVNRLRTEPKLFAIPIIGALLASSVAIIFVAAHVATRNETKPDSFAFNIQEYFLYAAVIFLQIIIATYTTTTFIVAAHQKISTGKTSIIRSYLSAWDSRDRTLLWLAYEPKAKSSYQKQHTAGQPDWKQVAEIAPIVTTLHPDIPHRDVPQFVAETLHNAHDDPPAATKQQNIFRVAITAVAAIFAGTLAAIAINPTTAYTVLAVSGTLIALTAYTIIAANSYQKLATYHQYAEQWPEHFDNLNM